jgi:TusA-related sulfurtransferase
MKVIQVDARGLEPPQPLVRILEALAALEADAELQARTDRRPLHLFPQLEQRGFRAECSEQADGGFLTVIRHA